MDAEDGRHGGSKWNRGGSVGPVVAGSHHLDVKQDPDLHYSEQKDPDPDRIKVMRIRMPEYALWLT